MKRLLTVSIILALVVLLFCACTDDSGAGADTSADTGAETLAPEKFEVGDVVTVADESGSAYTVVYGSANGNTALAAARTFRNQLIKATGSDAIKTVEADSETTAEKVILIGSTSFDESKNAAKGLGENDYRITFDGYKLVIVGGSDKALKAAFDYFTQTYAGDGKVAVKVGEDYSYKFEPKEVLIGDTDLSEFMIYVNGVSTIISDELNKSISGIIGIKLKVDDLEPSKKKFIELAIPYGFEDETYKIELTDKGNVKISADSEFGLYVALKDFEKILTEGAEISAVGTYPPSFEAKGIGDSGYFECLPNKDALTYKVGEEMEINIRLLLNGKLSSCYRFDWTMKGDDGKRETGSSDGSTGILTLKTTLDEPGFVMLNVKAIGLDGEEIDEAVRFNGSVGAEVEKVRQYIEEPADFDEFWEKAIAEMMTVKPEVLMMEEVSATSGFKAYKLKIACVGDKKWTGETYASAYLTYPQNAAKGSLPIKVCYQGAGVYSASPTCENGKLVLSMCTHSLELGQDSSYYSGYNYGTLKEYGRNPGDSADPNKSYFKYMLLRNLQALRFAKEFEGLWNGKDLYTYGISQGGYQALAIAGLDPDVTNVEALVPWMCDIGGYTGGKRNQAIHYEYGMNYFDTVNLGKRIKCKVRIEAGLGDTVCPPVGVMSMYNALTCEKELTIDQGRTHSTKSPQGLIFKFTSK